MLIFLGGYKSLFLGRGTQCSAKLVLISGPTFFQDTKHFFGIPKENVDKNQKTSQKYENNSTHPKKENTIF